MLTIECLCDELPVSESNGKWNLPASRQGET